MKLSGKMVKYDLTSHGQMNFYLFNKLKYNVENTIFLLIEFGLSRDDFGSNLISREILEKRLHFFSFSWKNNNYFEIWELWMQLFFLFHNCTWIFRNIIYIIMNKKPIWASVSESKPAAPSMTLLFKYFLQRIIAISESWNCFINYYARKPRRGFWPLCCGGSTQPLHIQFRCENGR